MMKRDECFRVLARHVTDEIVVSTYSSAVDWLDLGERALNYFSVGAMGLELIARIGACAGTAGPARHLPARRRQPADKSGMPGDDRSGGAEEPRAFRRTDGTYEANGGHPIPNMQVDFAAMARAAVARVHDFADLGNFEQQAGHVVSEPGPVFATLRVEPSKSLTYDYPRLYDPRRREALKAALQEG